MRAVYATGFPVGKYNAPGTPTQYRVRLGRDVHALDGVERFLWDAARAVGDPPEQFQDRATVVARHGDAMSRAVGLDLRNDAFFENADGAFERLAGLGLLVEVDVDPGRSDALSELAAAHTFRGLQVHAGPGPADQERVGAPGFPVHELSPAEHRAWTRADAAATLADAAAEAGGLVALLPQLHALMARGLGYLDRVVVQDDPISYVPVTVDVTR